MKIWRPESANFIVGAVIILLLAVGGWFVVNNFQSTTVVRIESAAYQVGLAATQAERDKGLSGIESLPSNGGLLLAFSTTDRWQIWMKDMLIPIDIIWLDDSKKVVYIVRDADPSGGTDTVFTPTKPARYVLEVPAGSAKQSGIKVGSTAIFSIGEATVE